MINEHNTKSINILPLLGSVGIDTKNSKVSKNFRTNILKTLSKMGGTKKSRNLHKLVNTDVLQLGYGASNLIGDSKITGVVMSTGTQLTALIIDIGSISSSISNSEILGDVKLISKGKKELVKARSTISLYNEKVIDNIDKEIDNAYDRILRNIDYFKLVDAYYNLLLEYFIEQSLVSGSQKSKLFEETSNVFNKMITTIFKSNRIDILDETLTVEFDALCDYFFYKTFADRSHRELDMSLRKVYDTELKFLTEPDIDVSKSKKMSDMVHVWKQLNITSISPGVFDTSLNKIIGVDLMIDIDNKDIVSFISRLISSKYNSNLFTATSLESNDIDKLEGLVLNFGKNVKFSRPKKIKNIHKGQILESSILKNIFNEIQSSTPKQQKQGSDAKLSAQGGSGSYAADKAFGSKGSMAFDSSLNSTKNKHLRHGEANTGTDGVLSPEEILKNQLDANRTQ